MKKQSETSPAAYVVFNEDRHCQIAAQVFVAATSRTRRRGLLGKERIEPETGLWIAPCEAIHTFGMKTAIDVIFLDRSSRVSKLISHLKPQRMAFCLQAASVLELGVGSIEPSAVQVGDQLRFQTASN